MAVVNGKLELSFNNSVTVTDSDRRFYNNQVERVFIKTPIIIMAN